MARRGQSSNDETAGRLTSATLIQRSESVRLRCTGTPSWVWIQYRSRIPIRDLSGPGPVVGPGWLEWKLVGRGSLHVSLVIHDTHCHMTGERTYCGIEERTKWRRLHSARTPSGPRGHKHEGRGKRRQRENHTRNWEACGRGCGFKGRWLMGLVSIQT